MKKLLVLLAMASLLFCNEKEFDVTKSFEYKGCQDELANKWTFERGFVLGLSIAIKDKTLNLLDIMGMTNVNGVEPKDVCKFYFKLVKDSEFMSKFVHGDFNNRFYFSYIVERSVVTNNGENHDEFKDNLKRLEK